KAVSEMEAAVMKESTANSDRLLHNLTTYNAHCLQASENIVDPDSTYSGARGQMDLIKRNFDTDPNSVAQSLLKIIKYNKLTQAEISVYNRLYKAKGSLMDKLNHNIHRLIRSALSVNWESFMEDHIT